MTARSIHPFPIADAIARNEFRLRLRSRSVPLQLFAMVALVALLVPRQSASYSLITVGERWLRLNQDTGMVALAVVLGVVLLLMMPLYLDFGLRRDRVAGATSLHGTMGLPAPVFGIGRYFGILLFGLLFIAASLTILTLTMWLRYGIFPSLLSIGLAGAILIKVMALSVPVAIVLEVVAFKSALVRSVLAFAWWTACVIMSIGGVYGFANFDALTASFPAELDSSSMSVGMVSIGDRASADWFVIAGDTGSLLRDGILGTAAFIAIGAAVSAALAWTCLRPHDKLEGGKKFGIPARWLESSATPAIVGAHASDALPKPPGPFASAVLVAQRMVKATPFGAATVALAFITGFASPAAGLILAHISAMMLVRPMAGTEQAIASRFEPTLSGLSGKRTKSIHILALAGLAVAAALPAMVQLPTVQALTALIGLVSASVWLVWTHRHTNLDILGTSILAGIIYLTGFNDMPPEVDILGFATVSTSALMGQAIITAVVAWLAFGTGRKQA